MKTSNHHIYYAAGLSWDYAERLYEIWYGNKHHKCRCRKNTTWGKQARSAIKAGKVDGINLKNYYAD